MAEQRSKAESAALTPLQIVERALTLKEPGVRPEDAAAALELVAGVVETADKLDAVMAEFGLDADCIAEQAGLLNDALAEYHAAHTETLVEPFAACTCGKRECSQCGEEPASHLGAPTR